MNERAGGMGGELNCEMRGEVDGKINTYYIIIYYDSAENRIKKRYPADIK